MITFKTQTIDFSDDINSLLCQIDKKIGSIAKRKLDSVRYGAEVCINFDDYKLLTKYRKILYDKAKGSCCLKGYLVDDIISRIKQLLNRN